MITTEQVQELVESYIEGTDLFIVEVKASPTRIAVYLDKAEGVTIDECAGISKRLQNEIEPSGVLEIAELEVSSPGMDFPLRVWKQYLRRIGRELHVYKLDGTELEGEITSVDENGVGLKWKKTERQGKKKIVTEESINLSFSEIKEAKLIINYKKNNK